MPIRNFLDIGTCTTRSTFFCRKNHAWLCYISRGRNIKSPYAENVIIESRANERRSAFEYLRICIIYKKISVKTSANDCTPRLSQ